MIIHCLDLGDTSDVMTLSEFDVKADGTIHLINSKKFKSHSMRELSDSNRERWK